MIRNLITLVFVFICGWLVYTQILGLGTEEEKEKGAELVQNAKETFGTIFGILKNEGQKIKDGTYDDAINKLGSLLDNLRANNKDANLQSELEELIAEEQRIKEAIEKSKQDTTNIKARTTGEESAEDIKTKEDIKNLTERVAEILKKMEPTNQ